MRSDAHVPPNLRDTVIRWSTEERLTSDRISERLLEEYGIPITGRNVRVMLERYRTELGNAAKAIARDALRVHLGSCVQVFVDEMELASWVQTAAMATGNARVVLEASRVKLIAAEKLLHFAGVDVADAEGSPEDPAGDIAEVRASLFARVEQMVHELKRKANGSVDATTTNGATGTGVN